MHAIAAIQGAPKWECSQPLLSACVIYGHQKDLVSVRIIFALPVCPVSVMDTDLASSRQLRDFKYKEAQRILRAS